jgi:hypothetical protein
MRVPEEPVCIDIFRQNPVFTSLHLKSPVPVHRLRMGEWEAGSYFYLRGLGRAWQGHCLTYGDGKMPSPCSGQYSQGVAETVHNRIIQPTIRENRRVGGR